jgi:thiol-disulfide isomerase/thioredoxin
VINFCGSWCVPCRKEAPVLRRVAADTRSLGVRFAGIDIREEPSAGPAFERPYLHPSPEYQRPGEPRRRPVRGGRTSGHPVHLNPRRPRKDRLGLVRRDGL